MPKLSPPPFQVTDMSDYVWVEWFNQLRQVATTVITSHNGLTGIQGGTTSERYHLTSSQYTEATTYLPYERSYQKVVPVSGDTVIFNNLVKRLILNPAGTLATVTVSLPSTPFDGQEICINTTKNITALSLSSSKTIVGATTSLTANTSTRYFYISSDNTWYKL